MSLQDALKDIAEMIIANILFIALLIFLIGVWTNFWGSEIGIRVADFAHFALVFYLCEITFITLAWIAGEELPNNPLTYILLLIAPLLFKIFALLPIPDFFVVLIFIFSLGVVISTLENNGEKEA